jgi:hypothetical protein
VKGSSAVKPKKEQKRSRRMPIYLGRCGHCGVGKDSENFKSRPSGRQFDTSTWLLEDDSGRKLRFFALTNRNDRVCNKCYDKNIRLRQGAIQAIQTPYNAAAPPRKRRLDFVVENMDVPKTPRAMIAKAITTPPSVAIVERPRNSRRRKIPRVDDSDIEMDTPITIPRMAGRSEAAHIVAQEFAAQLPESITLSSRSWMSSIMSFPCGNVKSGIVCGGHLDPFDFSSTRQKIEVKFVCAKCKAASLFFAYPAGEHKLEFVGPDEKKHKVKEDDMRTVLKILLSGSTHQQYSIMQAGESDRVPKATFYTIQKVICSVIVRVSEDVLEEERQKMRREFESGERDEWQAVCNGAWSHRGWTARHHTFQIRDHAQQRVVCSIVLTKSHYVYEKAGIGEPVVATPIYEGNYVGSSRAMENEAFETALEQLREAGLLKYLKVIVADGDLGIDSMLKKSDDTKHIRIAGDPGHGKKNFFKAMKDVCGASGPYMSFPYRISNFWMRCVKRAEKVVTGHSVEVLGQRQQEFEKLWKHALSHYSRKECPRSCPCNEFYQGGETDGDEFDEMVRESEQLLDACENAEHDEVEVVVPEVLIGDGDGENQGNAKRRFVAKKILDSAKPREKQLLEQLTTLVDVARQNASYVLWALNTCAAEGSNFRRLVFCRKDRFFYASYTARSCLSTLVENYGLEETFSKMTTALDFSQSDVDRRVCEDLAKEDEKRAWHSTRKKSVEYNESQKNAKMWKAGHNIDVKEAAQEKNKLKRSSYKTSQSDGVQVYDMFRRKRGRQSQEQLRDLFGKNMANQCRQCGKFYTRNGKHTKCSGVWKEHGLQSGATGEKSSKRQKHLKAEFDCGKARQCSQCKLYYKKDHRKCSGIESEAEGEKEKDFEKEISEESGEKEDDANFVEDDYDAMDISDEEMVADSENEIENVELKDGDELNVFDEQDLLIRNLVIPSAEDIEQLQLDESEIKSLEKKIWVEAPFLSCFATLLQKELGDVDMDAGRIPAFVFGPTLLFEFSDSDEKALKALFQEFFAARVLFLVLNKAKNHYVVIEADRFDSFVTVYDSSREIPKTNGQQNMRNVCSKYLDVPVLERVLRVLQLLGEERVWRFAENMPQQNNGRDCGIFAMEVARSRVRAALAADKDKERAEKDYQNLSHRRAVSYRRRLGAEFRSKKCDVAAKP